MVQAQRCDCRGVVYIIFENHPIFSPDVGYPGGGRVAKPTRRDVAADSMEANGALLAGRSLSNVCGYKATVVPDKGLVLTESQSGDAGDLVYWCVWQIQRG